MKDDWRLMGQEKYLQGVTVKKVQPKKYVVGKNSHLFHTHCEFCMETITGDSSEECFATLDNRHWICKDCFQDFSNQFNWNVVEGDGVWDYRLREQAITLIDGVGVVDLDGATLVPVNATNVEEVLPNERTKFCAFCFDKLSQTSNGYINQEGSCYICGDCFNDFHNHFKWKIKS